MKQGQASTSVLGSTKVEPKAHAVNPGAVSEMGMQVIRHSQIPIYEGRGLEAPMAGCESHAAGSQGRHK